MTRVDDLAKSMYEIDVQIGTYTSNPQPPYELIGHSTRTLYKNKAQKTIEAINKIDQRSGVATRRRQISNVSNACTGKFLGWCMPRRP